MLSDPNKKRQYDLHGEDASTNELGEKIHVNNVILVKVRISKEVIQF